MSKEFGVRLYYLRPHKTEYTHRQIAELLGVERSTYTKYENGVSEPPIRQLRTLKEILDVSYEELLETELSETAVADYEHFRRRKRTEA